MPTSCPPRLPRVADVARIVCARAPATCAAQDEDVVIVGGGLVGSALACALASSPVLADLRITVIDAAQFSPPPPPAGSYSNR